jgi:hypothetical protein
MNEQPGAVRRQVLSSSEVAASPLLPSARRAPWLVRERESRVAEKAADITRPSGAVCLGRPTDVVTTGLNIAIRPDCDILCQMGPVWNPGDLPVTLNVGASVYSPGRTFRLTMQNDGNVVLQYVECTNLPFPIWLNTPLPASQVTWVPVAATRTADMSVSRMDMQHDGNLVIYRMDGSQAWSTNTGGNIAAFFRVQDDGNLVMHAQGGVVIWTSNTSAGEAPGAGTLKGRWSPDAGATRGISLGSRSHDRG